jgi:cysteine-S-conjugate beta-lyase
MKQETKMQYDFDQVVNRYESECLKWHHYEGDILPLWVADMDFRSPEPVIRALHERVEHGVFGYVDEISPSSTCNRSITDTIVDWVAERYQWEIEPEEIVFLPGVVVGFNLACHTMAQPGGGVLIQTPVYFPFLSAPGHAGQVCQKMELTPGAGGRYAIDMKAFEQAITPETNLFILCNPHNPIGRVFQREELSAMAEICLRKGVTICSDEIHCDLIYPGNTHIPIASIDPEIARHTITLMAPSKTFNIPGLHSSFAVIQNAQLRRRYIQSTKGLVSSVNIMGLVAMQAAYQEGLEWLEQLMVYLRSNRDYLYEYIRQELPGVGISKPEGTYLAWLDFREAIPDQAYQFFLEKARVALNDGRIFGPGGEGFLRLNFACPRRILQEALQRMAEALRAA